MTPSSPTRKIQLGALLKRLPHSVRWVWQLYLKGWGDSGEQSATFDWAEGKF